MNLTFEEAWEALGELVNQLEADNNQLDSLAEKVRLANELIEFCELKLRTVETDLGDALPRTLPLN